MRRGTSSVDGNCLKDFLDTTTNNGAERCRIQQFYFSLLKFRSTAFQNTVDNCGNISMRQHLNVCLYQQHYTFFFGLKFAVEQRMAPHSSTLAWKIPWAEEPGRLQSMESLRVRHDWSDLAAAAAAEMLRTVPCTACSRELKGTQKLRWPYTFTGLSPGSSLIMMNSSEFFSRGSAHDKQGRLCFLIFSMMDK